MIHQVQLTTGQTYFLITAHYSDLVICCWSGVFNQYRLPMYNPKMKMITSEQSHHRFYFCDSYDGSEHFNKI